jgi:hypothetical protein
MRVDEELRDTSVASHREPSSQCRRGGLPQGQAALPSTLPADQQIGLRLKGDVIEAKTDQFGDPEAGRIAHMQHRAVTDTWA